MTTDYQQLIQLPRPVYGHSESLPNQALRFEHSHPWLQFSYARTGVLDVYTATGRFLAPPQRAVWIPAGVMHRVHCSAHTQIRSLYIEAQVLKRTIDRCEVVEVTPLLTELIQSFSGYGELYDEEGEQGRLVQVLLDQLSRAASANSMLPLPTDLRLGPLITRLQQQPDTDFSLNEWAQHLQTSEKTISRLFKQQTGLSFRLWRQRLRLLSALPLLEQQQPVTAVALACGYESISAFIHAFDQYFGCTPGEFFRPVSQ